MSYFRDGLWDIVLGFFFLGWGFAVFFNLGWLPGATFIAAFYIALSLKQKITYPRIGFSRPAEQRKQMSRLVIAGVAALLLGLIIFLVTTSGDTPQFMYVYFEFLFGTMLAVAIGVIGYWWGIIRWYVFAGLVFALAAFNQWLGLSFHLSFFIPGTVILAYGTFVFVHFLREHPKVSAEDYGENR